MAQIFRLDDVDSVIIQSFWKEKSTIQGEEDKTVFVMAISPHEGALPSDCLFIALDTQEEAKALLEAMIASLDDARTRR